MSDVIALDYNVRDFDPAKDPERCKLVCSIIAEQKPDVVTVNEIMGGSVSQANFVALAADLNMQCVVPTTRHTGMYPAFYRGNGARGMGVMWRGEKFTAVPGSCQTFDGATSPMTVGMVLVRLETRDGEAIGVAATQFAARRPEARRDEATYAAYELRVNLRENFGVELAMLGGDFQVCSDARGPSGKHVVPDPYASLPWDPRFNPKCIVDEQWSHRADRSASRQLILGGLLDPVVQRGLEPFVTTGHWPTEAASQRIDGYYVTLELAKRVMAVTSIDTPATRAASDHLPVRMDFTL